MQLNDLLARRIGSGLGLKRVMRHTGKILHPNRQEEEQWQYMIVGSDFVQDLLGMINIFKPVVDLMHRMQSLDCPVWKLRQYWPKIQDALQAMEDGTINSFATLKSSIDDLYPGGHYKPVELLEGWLIVSDKNEDDILGAEDMKDQRFRWKMREDEDVKKDRESIAGALRQSIDFRLTDVMASETLKTLEVLDAENFVKLQCGERMKRKS